MIKSRHELKLEAMRRAGLLRTPLPQSAKVEEKTETAKKPRKRKG